MTTLFSMMIIMFAVLLIILLEGLLFAWVAKVDIHRKERCYSESDVKALDSLT